MSLDVGLVVREAERSLNFYERILGLEVDSQIRVAAGALPPGTLYRIRVGDSTLKVLSFDESPSETNAAGPIEAACGVRYVTIPSTRIGEKVEAVRNAGLPVHMQATEIRPGVRIAFVEDPDGVVVELVETDSEPVSA